MVAVVLLGVGGVVSTSISISISICWWCCGVVSVIVVCSLLDLVELCISRINWKVEYALEDGNALGGEVCGQYA